MTVVVAVAAVVLSVVSGQETDHAVPVGGSKHDEVELIESTGGEEEREMRKVRHF